MSLSSTPSALIAATTFVICAAAVSRASFAVFACTATPRLTVARSGTTVTLPDPPTETVCSGVVPSTLGATLYSRWGAVAAPRTGPAMSPTSRPPAAMTRNVDERGSVARIGFVLRVGSEPAKQPADRSEDDATVAAVPRQLSRNPGPQAAHRPASLR